jgi:hypothetical protein
MSLRASLRSSRARLRVVPGSVRLLGWRLRSGNGISSFAHQITRHRAGGGFLACLAAARCVVTSRWVGQSGVLQRLNLGCGNQQRARAFGCCERPGQSDHLDVGCEATGSLGQRRVVRVRMMGFTPSFVRSAGQFARRRSSEALGHAIVSRCQRSVRVIREVLALTAFWLASAHSKWPYNTEWSRRARRSVRSCRCGARLIRTVSQMENEIRSLIFRRAVATLMYVERRVAIGRLRTSGALWRWWQRGFLESPGGLL